MDIIKTSSVHSKAEELFVELFCETFGPEKANLLYIQYPFVDIYGNHRYIDFALENLEMKIAIEIDGETYHNPKKIPEDKYCDDLLKQNSMVHDNWRVFRWTYNQLLKQADKTKDDLVTYLGESPFLKELVQSLPNQQGKTFELRDYQEEALQNLAEMRKNGETIALLYHATGVGKTFTATNDAKSVGGNTLFLVNSLNLADQAYKTFEDLWKEASLGYFTGEKKEKEKQILFATVQTMSKHLTEFSPDHFAYIVIDECHHAAAKTYQQIFSYFTPQFILGLSATPERADGEDMLELFQNVAHKMDLKTAVERGILAPIRCVRVKTHIDLTEVRIRGVRYHSQDLESKLFLPERNILLVDTYLNYVKDRKTVIFCASVSHAEEIATLLKKQGIKAESVSAKVKLEERNNILENYENGDISVLCACDLLNEGWDSPRTEVLFMARPTMSKVIYMQQLGRGTRKCDGKEDLLVFDFVDNGNMFNMPYSLHRMLDIKNYTPLEYVLAPEDLIKQDNDLLRRGEKPTAYIDIPVNFADFEVIDLFNWQKETKNMVSEKEFVRSVDVQFKTIAKYIVDEKMIPDMVVPIGDKRVLNYFKPESVKSYSAEFGWEMITASNMKDKFMEFVRKMHMSSSYKPVFLMSLLETMDADGKCSVDDVVLSVAEYYRDRARKSLIVEKENSPFVQEDFTLQQVKQTIFKWPFARYADMRFVKHCKNVDFIEMNRNILINLTENDISDILQICEKKLQEYYEKMKV